MKYTVWLLVIVNVMVLPGCDFFSEAKCAKKEKGIVRSGNFNFDLYTVIKNDVDQKGKNIFFSAMSIEQAMSLVNDGSRGATQQELTHALYLPDGEQARQEQAKRIQSLFNLKDKPYELTMANALWVARSFAILPTYRSLAQQLYGASVQEVDFVGQPKEALAQINGWVSKQTRGMIPNILSSVEPNTLLVITNATYFKGDWKHQFDEKQTTQEPFFVDANKQVTVPMMHKTENCLYAQTPTVHMIGLPYKGDELIAYVITPKDKNAKGNWFDAQIFSELKENATTNKVDISVPRLKIATEYKNVVNYFEKLGVNQLFTPPTSTTGADLSGIDGKRDVFVSMIIHKAALIFDEKGTTASAATAVVITKTSFNPEPIIEFKADHPYVLVIQDTTIQEVLFMGQIIDPTAV